MDTPRENNGLILPPSEPPSPAEKKDHPIWGLLICLVICGTGLLTVQMITDYHW